MTGSEGAECNSQGQSAAGGVAPGQGNARNQQALTGRNRKGKGRYASIAVFHPDPSYLQHKESAAIDYGERRNGTAQVHGDVFRGCKSPTLLIGGTEDYLHALFALSRTLAMADLVEEVKTSSSKWMKTKGDELRQFQWQAGYGAFSIGQSNVEVLKRYTSKQKEHHRSRSFQDELRSLCKRYGVEIDERYVWD